MRQSESKALSASQRPAPPRKPRACVAAVSLLTTLLSGSLAGCNGPLLTFRPEQTAEAGDPESTGSIVRASVQHKTFGRDLNEEDWRRASAALGVALDPQGNGRPVRWDNPETAMRGSISPSGLPYVASDEVCRDFLASVIGPGSNRFVRGTGCKPAGDGWRLKRLRAAKA